MVLEEDEYDRRKKMPTSKQGPPQFIPKLKGKKVIIRLGVDGI